MRVAWKALCAHLGCEGSTGAAKPGLLQSPPLSLPPRVALLAAWAAGSGPPAASSAAPAARLDSAARREVGAVAVATASVGCFTEVCAALAAAAARRLLLLPPAAEGDGRWQLRDFQ
jgi:hypothetical protein